MLTQAHIKRLLQIDSPISRFIEEATRYYIEFHEAYFGYAGCSINDPAALALVFFTFGLTSQAATALLVRVFYALQDVRTPLRIAAVVVAVNLITNLVLVRTPLAQGGLALGTSIAATLNAVLLARVLHRRLGGIESGDIARSAGRALLAVLPMAALAFVLFQVLLSGSAGSDLRHLAIVLVIIPLAGLTYVAIQRILGSEELGVLLSAVRPGSKG